MRLIIAILASVCAHHKAKALSLVWGKCTCVEGVELD